MVSSLHSSRWTTSSWFIFVWRTRWVDGDTLQQKVPSRLHVHHCWSRLGDCMQGLLKIHHKQDSRTLPLAKNQNSSVGGHVVLSWRFLSCLADMVQRQHRPFLSWEATGPVSLSTILIATQWCALQFSTGCFRRVWVCHGGEGKVWHLNPQPWDHVTEAAHIPAGGRAASSFTCL